MSMSLPMGPAFTFRSPTAKVIPSIDCTANMPKPSIVTTLPTFRSAMAVNTVDELVLIGGIVNGAAPAVVVL